MPRKSARRLPCVGGLGRLPCVGIFAEAGVARLTPPDVPLASPGLGGVASALNQAQADGSTRPGA